MTTAGNPLWISISMKLSIWVLCFFLIFNLYLSMKSLQRLFHMFLHMQSLSPPICFCLVLSFKHLHYLLLKIELIVYYLLLWWFLMSFVSLFMISDVFFLLSFGAIWFHTSPSEILCLTAQVWVSFLPSSHDGFLAHLGK